MTESLINTIYLAVAYIILFTVAELLYHKMKVRAEATRKTVHIATGIFALFFPILIDNHWLVLLLCGSFFLILIFSMKFKLLPSINAVNRVTYGSLCYPIIVYGCYLAFSKFDNLIYYYTPILILALCDPLAAFVGRNYTWGPYKTFGRSKSLSGSIAFFIAAFGLTILLLIGFDSMEFKQAIGVAAIVSLITTVAESLTHKGYDNLTVPIGALISLLAMLEYF